MAIITMVFTIVAAGWILLGFYAVGLKAADQALAQTKSDYDGAFYTPSLYVIIFLGGPIAIGYWKERRDATMLASNKSTD